MSYRQHDIPFLRSPETGGIAFTNHLTGADTPLATGSLMATISSTGNLAVGQVLTAVAPTGTIPSGFQWYRDTGAGPIAISGATGPTYTRTSSDVAVFGGNPVSITVAITSSQFMSSATVSYPPAAIFPNARKVLGLSMPFGDLLAGALTSNSSWRTVRRFQRPFKRIRCYLFNIDPANPMAGAKACWSPSESLANGVKPTIGGVVSDASSVQFLFGGSSTVTLPVGPGNGVPSVTVSDWLTTPSIAPTDGNPYPIGYFTTLFTSGAQIGYSTPNGISFQTFLEGLSGMQHAFRVYTNGGDCVSTPANFTSGGSTSFCVPMGIEVEYFTGGRTIIACGDSTLQGTGNTANAGAALMVLSQLDTQSNPANSFVLAQSGSTAARQDTKLRAIVAVHNPDIIYFQPFSVNDTSNYAGSSAATMARVDYWIAYCAANGINLILDTPLPIMTAGSAAVTGSELTALTAMYAYILGKVSPRVQCLDFTPFHSAPYSGVYANAYGFDNYHPNPAGHLLRATLLDAAIQSFG